MSICYDPVSNSVSVVLLVYQWGQMTEHPEKKVMTHRSTLDWIFTEPHHSPSVAVKSHSFSNVDRIHCSDTVFEHQYADVANM
eukprot:scaffold421247_cov37-Attheya_sp.AAC.1